MKPLLLTLVLVTLSGCATWDRYSKYIPESPVTMGTGDIHVLKVLTVGGYVQFRNPFAEAAGNTNKVEVKP